MSGLYTSTQHIIYIALTTVLATLITTVISSQLQGLFLLRLDHQLQQSAISHDSIPATKLEVLNRRWRTVLGIGSLLEALRNMPIKVTYVVAGLVTSAITAGLAPTVTNRVFRYNPTIPLGPNEQCVSTVYNLTDHSDYSWNLGNGSSLFIPAAMGWCPTRDAVILTGNINSISPNAFAYADLGVTVQSSAIGAPISIYSPSQSDAPELQTLLEIYGSNIVNTTQCVPVMQKNPISCHNGGTVSVDRYTSTIAAESDDRLCSYNITQLNNPATSSGSMIMKMCTHGEVGQGTMVLGAVSEFAKSLAGSIGDADFFNSPNSSSYVITCEVDTRDVYTYKMVTLEMQFTNTAESSYARALTAQGPCTPQTWTIGVDLIATSAAANWQLLSQNDGINGWFDTLNYITRGSGPLRAAPWAFNNSANALEDALGLISALVASRIQSTPVVLNGSALIMATRVGGGGYSVLVFAVPPAAAAIILAYLLITTPSRKPDALTTSSLVGLIEYRASGLVD
jgi:hypothetical protein